MSNLGDVIVWDGVDYRVVGVTKTPDHLGGQLVLETIPIVDPRTVQNPLVVPPFMREVVVRHVEKRAPITSKLARNPGMISDKDILAYAFRHWDELGTEILSEAYKIGVEGGPAQG